MTLCDEHLFSSASENRPLFVDTHLPKLISDLSSFAFFVSILTGLHMIDPIIDYVIHGMSLLLLVPTRRKQVHPFVERPVYCVVLDMTVNRFDSLPC
jgi:hypothetical protein